MIDFHTHSLFSDGELLPSELVQRARMKGYQGIAITDHVDASNLDQVVSSLVKVCPVLSSSWQITVLPGVEITHAPPEVISRLAQAARSLGASIVVVHGETIVEPVPPGTNAAALDAAVDILAHPGLITPELAAKAKERSIFLEITSRNGHSLTNGHVARLAMEKGAPLLINTDAHKATDLIDDATARRILRGAGIGEEHLPQILNHSRSILERIGSSSFRERGRNGAAQAL
ncbi:MAG: histidinol phosphate phosphatase domain-containing protein [candidate division NC10 bacterium]|nr:histidinol phosphate phosphatase domain-containing protein [candidate division NC10 bacterium]